MEDLLHELETDDAGLPGPEVTRRLEEVGPNRIPGGREISPFRIFVAQFRDFLIYLLVLAALLSVAVGFLPGSEPRWTEAILILLILLANGVFGFFQDYQAEKAMEALQEMATPEANVLRDGARREVPAEEVVPGDILLLEQGDRIPADARILEARSLETMESALTGESASVEKDPAPLPERTSLPDRRNMVYLGTSVVRGRGKAMVVATGAGTRLGSIARQIREGEERPTPFQEEVDRLGRRIGALILVLIAVLALVQIVFTPADLISVLLVAVTLAVAAVPEGLPAVVTLTLALGARRMLAKNALVRRLAVVEGLGSVDVIVTDKTGTLTESRMTVTRLWLGGEIHPASETDAAGLRPLLRCGVVANDAEAAPDDAETDHYGDPTEVAVLAVGERAGITAPAKDDRLREVPFSSERKRMTVVVEEEGAVTAYMKGAPEVVLERCDRILDAEGSVVELTTSGREEVLERSRSFAADAYRVLGFARREVADPDAPEDSLESGMVFLGLQALIDPPRPEVPDAVADCRAAGIRVVMVTGDSLETAVAIGRKVGFRTEGARTGAELEGMEDAELLRAAEEVEIFARVSPAHKVRILEALQGAGHRVAMTGDGVNDAPALRRADVGVAMGLRGTDVAKEASDMVLQDDDFVTIRNAVAEGRGIFDNIRKFVNFLLSANAGEVLVVFFGVLVGAALFPDLFASRSEGLVLTPVMLLWINLVTDGLPALALGVDPKSEGILERGPRPRDEPVIDRRMVVSIAAIGLSLAVFGLALFFFAIERTGDLLRSQTVLFTFLVTVEMGILQVIRSRFGVGWLENRWLVGAVASSLALHLLVLYTPLSAFFRVRGPDAAGWGWVVGATVLVLLLSAAGGLTRRLLGLESRSAASIL